MFVVMQYVNVKILHGSWLIIGKATYKQGGNLTSMAY
jgi:hypothetical protein